MKPSITLLCAALACATKSLATPTVIQQATLPPTSLELFGNTAAELAVGLANGMTRTDQPAIASGLQYLGNDRYLGVTDRGPTYQASGKRILPLPTFNPAIVWFRANGSQLTVESVLPLLTQSGQKVTGLTTSALDETAFANPADTVPIPFNPNGIDLEEVHTLPGGGYITVDEYNPSIAVIDSAGKVVKRYTPVSKTLAGADYPVSNTLPDVLKNRRNSRGFEGIAISPNGQTAFAVMQSPLGGTGATSPYRLSRVCRILRLNISDPANAVVTGHFCVLMTPAADYPATNRPQDLKFSAATWASENKLLLIERSDEVGIGGVRLLICDLTNATNFHGQAVAETLDLEDVTKGPAMLNVTPARTEIVFQEFETQVSPARIFPDYKLEGLAFQTPTRLAITNDNDFSQGNAAGNSNKLTVLEFGCELAAIAAPASGSAIPSSNVTFTWNTPLGSTEYYLTLDTFRYGYRHFSRGTTANSLVVPNLPPGATVYATLYTKCAGQWQRQVTEAQYTVQQPIVVGCVPAALTAPSPGGQVDPANQTFTWNTPGGATEYYLTIDTFRRGYRLFSRGTTANSLVVSSLPSGATVYTTLYTKCDGRWLSEVTEGIFTVR